MKNNSVYSNSRNMRSSYAKDIFKDKPLEFDKKYKIDGLLLMNEIKNDSIAVVFFDPQLGTDLKIKDTNQ